MGFARETGIGNRKKKAWRADDGRDGRAGWRDVGDLREANTDVPYLVAGSATLG